MEVMAEKAEKGENVLFLKATEALDYILNNWLSDSYKESSSF